MHTNYLLDKQALGDNRCVYTCVHTHTHTYTHMYSQARIHVRKIYTYVRTHLFACKYVYACQSLSYELKTPKLFNTSMINQKMIWNIGTLQLYQASACSPQRLPAQG